MTTSIEWLQLFVIPEEMSYPEAQIATLKHTLCKLNMLTEEMRLTVSSGMLKYMRYLDSPEKARLKEYILGELTETELEGLLSLVEYASEQLKKQESKKSAILRKSPPFGGSRAGLSTGMGIGSGLSPGLGPGTASSTNPFSANLSKEQIEYYTNMLKDKK